MKCIKSVQRIATGASVVALSAVLLSSGVANADTRTGWVGSTGPVGGNLLLHTSTISNTPLFADTRVYTAFGNTVPSGTMGVRSRLFTSGALCVIKPYKFNAAPASSLNDPTSGDCGPGFYNSHGFVRAWNGSDYQEFITFPSDPLQFGASTARTSEAPDSVSRNDRGESYGSAENVTDDAALPDLVEAIGTSGERGYLRKADLTTPEPSTLSDVLALPTDAGGLLSEPSRLVTLRR